MHSACLTVGLAERSYAILIGNGSLTEIGNDLARIAFPQRLALITNALVDGLYGDIVDSSLRKAGFKVERLLLPDGEEFKNHTTLMTIYDWLLRSGFDRHSGLVALGGGVIGDMVGFAAATYLRGIPFVQVPTTLLAQVDSSVGGKTGVNHPLGKNLIGAFCQPRQVQVDVATLATLSDRDYAAGLAEVVKYGVIRDHDFFVWLENHGELLKNRDRSVLIEAVKRSCQIKANVVEIDEHEDSLRAILNYGHTFGHAVETLSGYGTYRHGEAVAIGMVAAASLARQLGFCSDVDLHRIIRLLQAFNLPVRPPDLPLDDYLTAMGRDKKVKDGAVRFVLNHGIGDCQMTVVRDLPRQLQSVLSQLQQTEV